MMAARIGFSMRACPFTHVPPSSSELTGVMVDRTVTMAGNFTSGQHFSKILTTGNGNPNSVYPGNSKGIF
jgi:hypothetical protein